MISHLIKCAGGGVMAFALALTANYAAAQSEGSEPKEVASPVEKVFIPRGFDDNDNVELLVFGYYPNACYKTATTGFELDQARKTIYVYARSYRYDQENTMCSTLRLPFQQEVRLGMIKEGEYSVVYEGKVMGNLSVGGHTTSSPDEFLYAPVDNVIVAKTLGSDKSGVDNHLTLLGRFPRLYVGCMQLVRVELVQESDDILVVKPISEIFDDTSCVGNYDFKVTVPVQGALKHQSLIHVRVANGNAKNQVYLSE